MQTDQKDLQRSTLDPRFIVQRLKSGLARFARPFYLQYFYLRRFPEEIPYLHPWLRQSDEGYVAGRAARLELATKQMARGLLPVRGENQTVLNDPSVVEVLFPPTFGWGEMMQRLHHIARQLSQSGIVCWFGEPRRLWTRTTGDINVVDKGVLVVREPFRFISPLPGKRLWLWISSPIDSVYGLKLNLTRIIYDVCDHPRLHSVYGPALLHDHEALLHRATIVTVSSVALQEAVRPMRSDALLVPNGVTYEDFTECEREESCCHLELSDTVRDFQATIVYIGALAPWFDWDLVASCADAHPDILFLLIGPLLGEDPTGNPQFEKSKTRPDDLFRRSNLHWTGERPYCELPAYMQLCTAAMIPFKVNEITQAVSPLKLFEYAAVGLPTVATGLRECRREALALVCRRADEFVSRIPEICEQARDPEVKRRLIEGAKERTWSRRLEPVVRAILKSDGTLLGPAPCS